MRRFKSRLTTPLLSAEYPRRSPVEAASLSRAARSQVVLDPIARAFHTTYQALLPDVAVTPVPQTGNISFMVTAASAPRAVALVDAVSTATNRYVRTNANSSQKAASVLAQYRAALAALSRLNHHASHASRRSRNSSRHTSGASRPSSV